LSSSSENILLGQRLLDRLDSAWADALIEALDLVALRTDFRAAVDRPTTACRGGPRPCPRPALVLADERPRRSDRSCAAVLDLLLSLAREEGAGVIVVSHDRYLLQDKGFPSGAAYCTATLCILRRPLEAQHRLIPGQLFRLAWYDLWHDRWLAACAACVSRPRLRTVDLWAWSMGHRRANRASDRDPLMREIVRRLRQQRFDGPWLERVRSGPSRVPHPYRPLGGALVDLHSDFSNAPSTSKLRRPRSTIPCWVDSRLPSERRSC